MSGRGLPLIERRDILPGLLGVGAIGVLLYLIGKGLTAKRPTLRAGYRKIHGKIYEKLYTYSLKGKAQMTADGIRSAGGRARVIQNRSSKRWEVWRAVRV